MIQYITEFIELLLNGMPLPESLRLMIEKAYNAIMRAECDACIGHDRYSRDGKRDNYRNGERKRDIDSKYGVLHLNIPRDRNGEYKQHTIPDYKRHTDDLETMVITLYKHGITTREIANLLEEMFGKYYTPATICNMAKSLEEEMKAFHARKLSPRYVVVYADSTYINVRRGSVEKEALHVFVGITPEGRMEVIDYELFPTESADNYMTMLRGFKERGMEEVLLFVTDGLMGFRDAILQEFPKAEHQLCWVHMQRNAMRKVRSSDRKEITADLKKVYTAPNKEEAEKELTAFCQKHKARYPKVTAMFDDRQSLFSFYDYPIEIRNSLYTTNVIENLNKHLKRVVKSKEQFPNEDSLDKTAYCHYSEFNARHYERIYHGFAQCQKEIEDMFDARYPKDANKSDMELNSSLGQEETSESEVAI